MRKILSSLAAIAMLGLPGVAAAEAPGGNAGVDEYTETIPGGGGSTPTNDRDEGGSGSSDAGPLSPAQVAALEAEGADGAAAAQLAQSTGPDRSDRRAAGSDGAPAGDKSSGGAGIAAALGDAASGSDDGMGVALPIILGLALLAAVGFVVARRAGGTATEA